MIESLSNQQYELPTISDDRSKIFYWKNQFPLRELTISEVLSTGISKEFTTAWLLAHQKWTIYHYNIPQEYLQYAVVNEILCPEVRDNPWKCLDALKQELNFVPQNILQQYIEWRIQFFTNMVLYYRQDFIDEEYAVDIQKCIKYLQELLSQGTNTEINNIL